MRKVTRETPQFLDAPSASKRKETKPTATDPKIGRVTLPPQSIDDLIGDVFEATQDLWMETNLTPVDVAKRMLDLALEKIPAEAGTFFLADLNSPNLNFAAIRGPKAEELRSMDLKVEVGQGIVGFCAQEGVCLAIHDMQNDSRYFPKIAEKVGYRPENTLCAPAENEGRLYGAIQLINAQGGAFAATQMELIRYIGITTGDILGRIEAAA
jgi:GAF domain-containing protein